MLCGEIVQAKSNFLNTLSDKNKGFYNLQIIGHTISKTVTNFIESHKFTRQAKDKKNVNFKTHDLSDLVILLFSSSG